MSIDNRVVREGSPRRFVTTLQRQLVRENPSALPLYGADGVYGDETREWVEAFQDRKGLTVDGIAGPLTLGQLREDIIYRPGTSGRGVELLQTDLMYFTVDLSPFGADGEYGSTTERGVRDFQTYNSLSVDGVAGPNTFYSIDESYETLYVEEGSEGALVRRIQDQLNEQEEVNISITVDGNFGPLTKEAVESFQEAVNLNVDGIVGPHTMAVLNLEATTPLSNEDLEQEYAGIGINMIDLTNSEVGELVSNLESNNAYQNVLGESLSEERAGLRITSDDESDEDMSILIVRAEENNLSYVMALFADDGTLNQFGIIDISTLTFSDLVRIRTYDIDGQSIEDSEMEYAEVQNLNVLILQEVTDAFEEYNSNQRIGTLSFGGDALGIACNILAGGAGWAAAAKLAGALSITGGPAGVMAGIGGLIIGGTIGYYACPSSDD